jgi:hypothetical protein
VHQVCENAIEVTFGAGIENIRLKAKAMGLPEASRAMIFDCDKSR